MQHCSNFSELQQNHEACLREKMPERTLQEFLRRLRVLYDTETKSTLALDAWRALQADDIISWHDLTRTDSTQNCQGKITDKAKGETRARANTSDSNGETPKNLLQKLVVVKLNGGIATTMSLKQPKSEILLKENLSFLQLLQKQMHGYETKYQLRLPIIFMNSKSQNQFQFPPYVMGKDAHPVFQNRMPRIFCKNLMPLQTATEMDWYPPGHGDVLDLLSTEETVQWCLNRGIEYAFISNMDNLNATVDLAILRFLLQKQYQFAAEITAQTAMDLKGGFFLRSRENYFKLLETSQISKEERKHKSIKENKFFNINNIWIRLDALWEKKKQNTLHLNVVVNRKEIQGEDIFQLETAAASAIEFFRHSCLIQVPRHRFAPVKTFSDLLIKRSDCYALDTSSITLNYRGTLEQEPLIQLDAHYQNLDNFEAAFPFVPSLRECRSLQIQGEFIFDHPDICLQGDVSFVNHTATPVKVSEWAGKRVFENQCCEIGTSELRD